MPGQATQANAMEDGKDASELCKLPASIGLPMLPFGVPSIPSIPALPAIPAMPPLPLALSCNSSNPQAVTKDVPPGGGRTPYMGADPDDEDTGEGV